MTDNSDVFTQELFDDLDNMLAKNEQKKDTAKYKSYLPSPFITAALPVKNVKKGFFLRKYNNITLNITSPVNVPYGKYGRLLLTVFTTHAVINKKNGESVTIQYKSLNQLLRELQLPTARCNEIKEQLDSFAGASFIFTEKVTTVTQPSIFKDLDLDIDLGQEVKATTKSTGHISFIKSLRYVDVEDRKGDKTTAAIEICLNEDFVKFSQEHSVPINYSIYKDITSSLGKDLYAWFVYRNNSINEPLYISRDSMVNQFLPVSENKASEEKRKDQSRANWQKIKEQILLIKEKYYPELNVQIDKSNMGITLYKSKPPVESDDQRYILVSANLQ